MAAVYVLLKNSRRLHKTLTHPYALQIPHYLLIIAGSGRMLAQLAYKNSLSALVIDQFADADTQYYARDFVQVPSLAKEHLIPAIDYFVQCYGVIHAIYGSGFETYPDSLTYLNNRLVVLGNSPDTFIKLLDKRTFFSTLDDLKIPYPETTFDPPDSAVDWLVKPMRGQGGVGVMRYQPDRELATDDYFQKYQPGASYSVLFLTNGQQSQVIGFNRQWTIDLSEYQPFIFSGIINSCDLLTEQKALVTGWLMQLGPILCLKGLNSLDFICSGKQSYLLEINPRPSASMQLYDDNLLIRHIQSIQGCLSVNRVDQSGYAAYQVVYAERDIKIPESFNWPDGCLDLPEPGALIRTGQPICSMIAHQNNAQSVLQALQITQHNLIQGLYSHGIPS